MQRYRHYTNGLGKKKKKKFLRPRQSRKVAGQNIIIIKFDSFMSTRYTRDPRVTQECPVWELITPHPRHKRDLCTQCKSRPNACKVYSRYLTDGIVQRRRTTIIRSMIAIASQVIDPLMRTGLQFRSLGSWLNVSILEISYT